MENIISKTKRHYGINVKEKIPLDEQAGILLKPIIMLDKAYELFSDLPKSDFIYREKQCYNICKKNFDKFYTWAFLPYTMDERYRLDDIMTEANEFVSQSSTIMELAFHRYLMFLDTHHRCIVAKLYAISTIVQCASMLLGSLRQNNDSIAKLNKNIYELQRAYFTRIYPHRCLVNPNNEKDIHDCVEGYVEQMLNHKIILQ